MRKAKPARVSDFHDRENGQYATDNGPVAAQDRSGRGDDPPVGDAGRMVDGELAMTTRTTAAVVTQWLVAGVVATVLTVQLAFAAHRVYTICTRPTADRGADNVTAEVRAPAGVLP
jgi:hypothetical protein